MENTREFICQSLFEKIQEAWFNQDNCCICGKTKTPSAIGNFKDFVETKIENILSPQEFEFLKSGKCQKELDRKLRAKEIAILYWTNQSIFTCMKKAFKYNEQLLSQEEAA